MTNRNIDPFGDFLNQIKIQNTLLKETLNEWDALLNTGLIMVKDLEESYDKPEAKPTILFLKELFSSGQGLSCLIFNRFSIIRDIAQANRDRSFDA